MIDVPRLGFVSYANASPFSLPYLQGHLPCPFECIAHIPTILNQKLKNHELDVALTSSVGSFSEGFSSLSHFGIAAQQTVLSVNLYTRFPLSELDGKTVGVTEQSATSHDLLKLLCMHLWKVEPHFISLDREKKLSIYDALLLIGDEALRQPAIKGFDTVDLGEEWYKLTGLPFVFALFVCRNELVAFYSAAIEKHMEMALQWSDQHQEHLISMVQKKLDLPKETLKKYFSCLYYRLEKKEHDSLLLFKKLRETTTYVSAI
jgi:predicted solute-binding protein